MTIDLLNDPDIETHDLNHVFRGTEDEIDLTGFPIGKLRKELEDLTLPNSPEALFDLALALESQAMEHQRKRRREPAKLVREKAQAVLELAAR